MFQSLGAAYRLIFFGQRLEEKEEAYLNLRIMEIECDPRESPGSCDLDTTSTSVLIPWASSCQIRFLESGAIAIDRATREHRVPMSCLQMPDSMHASN